MRCLLLVATLLSIPVHAFAQSGDGELEGDADPAVVDDVGPEEYERPYDEPDSDPSDWNTGPRAGLHLSLGFGGNAKTEVNVFAADYALAPTLGFAFRFEMPIPPIARFFSVGALVEVLSFNPDSPGAEGREQVLDLSVLLKGRYPIRVGENELAPYLVLPFGGSVWFIDDADNYRGINTGLLGGAEFTLGRISIFAEFGWRYHRVKDGSILVRASQAALNLGAMFIF